MTLPLFVGARSRAMLLAPDVTSKAKGIARERAPYVSILARQRARIPD
jgi:hypothetical protein